jgi:hypothetical protein
MEPRETPPVASAPANATNLGQLSVPANGTVTLKGGDYVISRLDIGNGGELAVASNGQPVNIYIKNNNSGVVVNAGNGVKINATGSAGNLRVWYPGNAQVNVGMGSTMNWVVAAPSSRIQIGMSSTIRGALIGNRVHIKKNSHVIYDASLKVTGTKDMSYNLGPKKIDHREAVSWQELDQ